MPKLKMVMTLPFKVTKPCILAVIVIMPMIIKK